MFLLKTILGGHLKSHRLKTQTTEAWARLATLNIMTRLGAFWQPAADLCNKAFNFRIIEMKKLKLVIKPSSSDDLKTLLSITDNEYINIISHLEKLSVTHPFHPNDLQSLFEIFIKEKSIILAKQLISIYKFSREQEVSNEDCLNALNESIENMKDKGWTDAEVFDWKRVSRFFSKLLSLDPICRVAKTLELSKEYDSILQRAQILVDIRPIFDDSYKGINGCLISQTLYLNYENNFDSKKISILIGRDKIKSLQASCEKALNKIAKIEEMMNKVEIKTLTIGDENDD